MTRDKGQVTFRLILMGFLVLMLSACSVSFSFGGFQPTREVVQRAIALQLNITKAQLEQHLLAHHLDANPAPGYEVNRVEILAEDPLEIQGLLSYHIRGTYNLTLKLPDGRVTDRGNPFDIYLQRQKEGKTWRLAQPQPGGKNDASVWATYLIRPKDYVM